VLVANVPALKAALPGVTSRTTAPKQPSRAAVSSGRLHQRTAHATHPLRPGACRAVRPDAQSPVPVSWGGRACVRVCAVAYHFIPSPGRMARPYRISWFTTRRTAAAPGPARCEPGWPQGGETPHRRARGGRAWRSSVCARPGRGRFGPVSDGIANPMPAEAPDGE
jgi:hypothetical protein